MFCSRCGNELSEDANFCFKCGLQITKVDENIAVDEWFYISDNMRYGPYGKEQMLLFIQQGQIFRDTLVWKKGMPNWIPASQTELEYTIRSVMPPVPNEAVRSKYAWSLAIIPIFTSIVTELLGFSSIVVSLCTLALNILYLKLDYDDLKKAGINANSWMWMGLVLIPVYLFVRASKTNKDYGYVVAWAIMFFLNLML